MRSSSVPEGTKENPPGAPSGLSMMYVANTELSGCTLVRAVSAIDQASSCVCCLMDLVEEYRDTESDPSVLPAYEMLAINETLVEAAQVYRQCYSSAVQESFLCLFKTDFEEFEEALVFLGVYFGLPEFWFEAAS